MFINSNCFTMNIVWCKSIIKFWKPENKTDINLTFYLSIMFIVSQLIQEKLLEDK